MSLQVAHDRKANRQLRHPLGHPAAIRPSGYSSDSSDSSLRELSLVSVLRSAAAACSLLSTPYDSQVVSS